MSYFYENSKMHVYTVLPLFLLFVFWAAIEEGHLKLVDINDG